MTLFIIELVKLLSIQIVQFFKKYGSFLPQNSYYSRNPCILKQMYQFALDRVKQKLDFLAENVYIKEICWFSTSAEADNVEGM